jgi:beta-glucanase (GH16 family)
VWSVALASCGGGGGAGAVTPSATTSPQPDPGVLVADAGSATSLPVGCIANLNAGNSHGALGRQLTYAWSFITRPAGSTALLSNAGAVAPDFVPDVAGNYSLALRVTDGTSAASTTVSVSAIASDTPCGYRLVWSDEFDAAALALPDVGKWDYDVDRNLAGWYNNELQYYANARLQNSSVSNGTLKITALREDLTSATDWGGQHYTSARMVTRGKASWTYGFFEIRAKLPCSAGSWPAIWTLGTTTNQWPAQGEIDIMEQTGMDKTVVLGTVHTPAGFGGNGSTGNTVVADACNAFHKYQIHWTADSIRFLIDGRQYRPAYTNPRTGLNAWPFDLPQYLILNVAVGGTLGGSVTSSTFPMTMEIDYVRVYQNL